MRATVQMFLEHQKHFLTGRILAERSMHRLCGLQGWVHTLEWSELGQFWRRCRTTAAVAQAEVPRSGQSSALGVFKELKNFFK